MSYCLANSELDPVLVQPDGWMLVSPMPDGVLMVSAMMSSLEALPEGLVPILRTP